VVVLPALGLQAPLVLTVDQGGVELGSPVRPPSSSSAARAASSDAAFAAYRAALRNISIVVSTVICIVASFLACIAADFLVVLPAVEVSCGRPAVRLAHLPVLLLLLVEERPSHG
jgi:hypothetical protein